jgi:hypothetical protein
MELLLFVAALGALFIAYRHGKLAGVVAQIKAAQPKVVEELQAVKPTLKATWANFVAPAPKADDPLRELLDEVRALKGDVAQLKAKSGAA